jgi:general secretion pathway protein L
MSKLIGIDIRPHTVRIAVLRTSYRRAYLEALHEVDRREHEDLGAALREVVGSHQQQGEGVGVVLEGNNAFIHRIALPLAALKQVEEVLPFELEARVPVDMESLVYDFRVLPRASAGAQVDVLAAAASSESVEARIELVKAALGHEPEYVSVGPLALGNLASVMRPLRDASYAAVLELGDGSSELVVMNLGVTVFARTLSVGVELLPDGVEELLRSLKQTLIAWETTGESPVTQLFICGGGAEVDGMTTFLGDKLGIPVSDLPAFEFETIHPDHVAQLPRFAKAVGIALGMRPGSKDLNLRQGELVYQRGFGFLKQKVPLLAGLAAVMLLSFLFWAWAEGRALGQQNEALTTAVAELAKQTLGEETDDAAHINELLDTGGKEEKDPQPELDAFDLALLLASQIPKELQHDIDELELQRGHVKLQGVVNSTEDAQKIAESLKRERCLKDVNISKITQVVKSSRQKYSMEFDVRCHDEKKKKASAADGEEG